MISLKYLIEKNVLLKNVYIYIYDIYQLDQVSWLKSCLQKKN